MNQPAATAESSTPSDLGVEAWRTVFDEADVAHVVPKIGPTHVLSAGCWCHPVFERDRYSEPAWSHNVAQ
jgi:hypothetical protein